MMTWKQKCEEERFYEVRQHIWNSRTEECVIYTAGEELTFEEAEALFDSLKITAKCVQVDVYREYEDSFEKIAVKDEFLKKGTWDSTLI